MHKIGEKITSIVFRGDHKTSRAFLITCRGYEGDQLSLNDSDIVIPEDTVLIHKDTRAYEEDGEWCVEIQAEVIGLRDEWLSTGNCKNCRRAKYCTKPCKAFGKAVKKMIDNSAQEVLIEHFGGEKNE